MRQLLNPSSFGVIQPLFKFVYNDLVYSLDLSVSPRIGWSRIFVLYTQVRTVLPKSIAVKLKTIIWDEHVRNAESCNNILPDEPFNIHIPDIS